MNFNEVFSPIMKHGSIRVFWTMIALYDLELEQLDVKTTFLHGEFVETVYIIQMGSLLLARKIRFTG